MKTRLLPLVLATFAASWLPEPLPRGQSCSLRPAPMQPRSHQHVTRSGPRSAVGAWPGQTVVRRRGEINWDGVPDIFATPNDLPADFFNVNSPRGVIFLPNDPGDTFQVSATAASGLGVEFSNVDPSYDDIFQTFSAERLFNTRRDTTMDVVFRVPPAPTPRRPSTPSA